MKSKTNYVHFTEDNVYKFKSSGKPIEYYYDTGCKGLAIAVSGYGREPKYIVYINRYNGKKCLGPTRKIIAGVKRIPLNLARDVVKNIYANKDEFMRMDIRRGTELYDDYKHNGPLPRKLGELPMRKVNTDTTSELKYKKLLQENSELKWVLKTVAERLERLSDSIDNLMDSIC